MFAIAPPSICLFCVVQSRGFWKWTGTTHHCHKSKCFRFQLNQIKKEGRKTLFSLLKYFYYYFSGSLGGRWARQFAFRFRHFLSVETETRNPLRIFNQAHIIFKKFLKYQSISVDVGAGSRAVCLLASFFHPETDRGGRGTEKSLGVQIPSKLAQGELMNGEMFRFLLI